MEKAVFILKKEVVTIRTSLSATAITLNWYSPFWVYLGGVTFTSTVLVLPASSAGMILGEIALT